MERCQDTFTREVFSSDSADEGQFPKAGSTHSNLACLHFDTSSALFRAMAVVSEVTMHEAILKSGRDSLLVAIPMVALLFVVFFRLDEWLFRSKRSSARRPPPRGVDSEGRPIFSDPDGHSRNHR